MSFFNPTAPCDYPAYLVSFQTSGSDYGSTENLWSFVITNANWGQDPLLEGNTSGALGVISSFDTGLIAAIASYLESSGWDGTVSNLSVTRYTEAHADVTPS